MTINRQFSSNYNDRYFAWQKTIGEFGGWANLTKFKKYISLNSDVLDFGCGGGYLLKQIDCHKRVGVEPNPLAAEMAKQNGVEIFSQAKDVPDEYIDVIISNNALEHTFQPLDEIRTLRSKLKSSGTAIFIVPCETIYLSYKPLDQNHHLYSWSPLCLGNLFVEAGYDVIEAKPYIDKWPPYYRALAKLGGRNIFNMACWLYGRIERSWFQVKVVATKSE
jgi:SAM-dependent methyltransferase